MLCHANDDGATHLVFPLWISDVEAGSVHDLTAARDQVLGALYWAASRLDLPTLADPGYEGTWDRVTHARETGR